MTHPLNGKWDIVATTPLGQMQMIATMNVNDDGKTFEGSATYQGQALTLENGRVDGNTIDYELVMKLGIVPMRFVLHGTFNEADWTCEGIAKALKMECSYTGKKILD